MGNFVSSHQHRLNRIKSRLSNRLKIVVNFDTYEEAVAALQDTTVYFDLMERIFLNHNTNDDGDDEDDETDARTQPILLATFQYNWSHHVTTTGLTYFQNMIDARTSWQQMPSKDATRRLNSAQTKLTYFNEGATKDVIHYKHLKYLLGGATLTAEHRAIEGEGPN
ncbi:hypothetical protein JTB14_001346 [Gonioctena quinquepunctata]|nr:hypothetical protein JTB14_001346 [Gonioctena quinquepunctata]